MSLSIKQFKEEFPEYVEKIDIDVFKWVLDNRKYLISIFNVTHSRSPFDLNVEVKGKTRYYCISFMGNEFDIKNTNSVTAILDWRYLLSKGCPHVNYIIK